MAQIMFQLNEFDTYIDCSLNPEFILLSAEDEQAVCDQIESLWLAGAAVTKPHSIDY